MKKPLNNKYLAKAAPQKVTVEDIKAHEHFQKNATLAEKYNKFKKLSETDPNTASAMVAGERLPGDQLERFGHIVNTPGNTDKQKDLNSMIRRSDPESTTHEHLMNFAHKFVDHSNTGNQEAIIGHKSFDKQKLSEDMAHHASKFWSDFTNNSLTDHFAAIKSHMSSKPEKIKHQGFKGDSSEHEEYIPHLGDHAKRVQGKVMDDDKIEKKNIRGIPHVLVHRGVHGDYAAALKIASGYNEKENTIPHKILSINSIPANSWSTNKEVAEDFARKGRDNSAIISQWKPVSEILHSGFHSIHPLQDHPYPEESELVFKNEKSKQKIPTQSLEMGKYELKNGETQFKKPKKT